MKKLIAEPNIIGTIRDLRKNVQRTDAIGKEALN